MTQATIGVIGGSGLYSMEGLSDVSEVTLDTVYGHPSDKYVIGTLAGQRVAFLPRHGRGHRYMPSEVPSRANIYGFKQLGVKYLISVSAVGSLNEAIAPGNIVIPDQVFDRTKGLRPATFFGNGVVVHIAFDHPFCSELRARLLQAAQKAGTTTHDGGSYMCMEGPQFSTYGESQLYRREGHSVIGMTAMPEAKLAREAEIAYAMLALVTDYDCWHPDHASVTVDQVVRTMEKNVSLAQAAIREVVPLIGEGFESNAHHALQNAIMTDPKMIPTATRERVALLLDKYLTTHGR